MATLTYGGTTVSGKPTPPEPVEDIVEMLGDTIWDNMIAMQMYRYVAIHLWERVVALTAKIEANPGSKSLNKAEVRRDDLHEQIRIQQYQFLLQEQSAEDRWVRLTRDQREEIEADTMLGVSSGKASAYGCWYRQLGSAPPPPKGCHLDLILFRFVFPLHAAAYNGVWNWHDQSGERIQASSERSKQRSTASGSHQKSKAGDTKPSKNSRSVDASIT